MQNSSYSHGQKPELSSCKQKVITSIHSWANCSNSAVTQQSTPASELICIYHGCLLHRFSQANWSRENVSNDNIMPTTHFLQITFALCVYCLQSVWKTSNEKEDMFLILSTYSNPQKNPNKKSQKTKQTRKASLHSKALQMRKPRYNFAFCLFCLLPFYIFHFFFLLLYSFLSSTF